MNDESPGSLGMPRVAAYLLTAAALASVAFAFSPSPPVAEIREAREALAAARTSDVEEWAADLLAEAEGLNNEGLALYEAERERMLLLRSYDAAIERLSLATERALLARRQALQRRRETRAMAEAAIDEGEAEIAKADEAAGIVSLPLHHQLALSRARMALNEARFLMNAEAYAASLARGRDATHLAAQARSAGSDLAARFGDRDSLREWRSWVDRTLAASRRGRSHAVIVNKDEAKVSLYKSGKLVRTYEADMGANNAGRKALEGDRATPEGTYRIVRKLGRGRSIYHKALLLDYPNATDRKRHAAAVEAGTAVRGADLGDAIEIHGEGGRGKDWTDGCVALSNKDMDHLYARVDVGTPVTIVGSLGEGGKFSSLAGSTGGTARE